MMTAKEEIWILYARKKAPGINLQCWNAVFFSMKKKLRKMKHLSSDSKAHSLIQ